MKTLRQIKRITIFVIGVTVMLAGLALVFLPGPAFIVIPAGLGILAIEFEWARRWLRKAKEAFQEAKAAPPSEGTNQKPMTAFARIRYGCLRGWKSLRAKKITQT